MDLSVPSMLALLDCQGPCYTACSAVCDRVVRCGTALSALVLFGTTVPVGLLYQR